MLYTSNVVKRMMSTGRAVLFIILAIFLAGAMGFVCLSDDSSAERNDRCEPPPEERPVPREFMKGPQGTVAIDPGHMHGDPFSMIMDYEKVSAEKKHLESQGKEVFVIGGPGPEHQSVLDEIMKVLGPERFITQEQADSIDFEEIVDIGTMSEGAEDDSFLRQISEAIAGIDPETSHAVENVLSLRERVRSYELYQRAVAVGYYSAADRRDDAEDEEDIEDKVIFEEEETESREPVVFEVPALQISDGNEGADIIIGDPSAVLMHGAADGPGL